MASLQSIYNKLSLGGGQANTPQAAGGYYLGGLSYPGSIQLIGGTDAPPPEPPVVLVVGPYKVEKHIGGGWDTSTGVRYVLCHGRAEKKRKVCSWSNVPPSRKLLAAVIRDDRQHLPRQNARDEFGALLGVRLFKLTGDYFIQSPTQGTVWESSVLTAPHWDEGEAVRGACGIHAAWPARSWTREPLIDHANTDLLVAAVRGMGKYVIGPEGWRAEKAIIDRVFLPAAIWSRWRVKKRLAALYPEISFEEEPWTLEKSLKSAK